MDFQNDPELEKLFKDELDERSKSLADGARAMAAGEITADLAGTMLREGHTIKGTGRVMGYEGIARGGETCELVWRWVQQGDIEPSSMLARTLEHLAEAIPTALGGDEGPISVAIDTVRALIMDDDLVAQLPEPLVGEVADTAETAPSPADEAPEQDPIDDTPAVTDEPESVELTDDEEEPQVIDVRSEAPVSLDAGDIADVSAALDAIEAEVAAAAEPTPVPVDESEMDTEDDRDEMAQPEVAQADVTQAEPVPVSHDEPSDDEPVAHGDPVDEPTPVVEAMPTVDEPSEPLVFEPGPDGRLPTPEITYEIVASTFADDPVVPTAAAESTLSTPPPLGEPQGLSLVDTGPSALDPSNEAIYDLGGLVGAVETWATEESVPVNAGRLFRMINDAAALRIDLEAAVDLASQLLQASESTSGSALESALESLETVRRASISLQTDALGLTMMPLDTVISTLPQLAKYLSKKVDRDVELVIEGEDTIVDRQLVDRIGEIIRQLVVNAVAHGIEDSAERARAGKPSMGTVKVALSRNEQHLQIVVADDGAGIDWKGVRDLAQERGLVGDDPSTEELRSVLYTDGFSTNPGSSEFTGDGEGLARVTAIVEEVFGTLTLDSTHGRGTTFVVTMPAHRALQSAQIFTAGGRMWGIPDSSVVDIKGVPDVSISVTERGSFISFGDESVPYSSFSTVVGLDVEGLPAQVMIVQSPTGHIALAVDEVQDVCEVATKDLSPLLSGSSTVVSGVALLGGDDTVMLVDAGRLAEQMREVEARPEGPVHTVLVVDDSQGVRQVVSGVLASHGFSTLVAGSVSDALSVLAKHGVDALVVDFSMPRADGVALIHMVRQRYGDIPVVMLSGVANDEDRTRAERAGADAFYDKADFAKGALVEKLRELIDGERATSAAAS